MIRSKYHSSRCMCWFWSSAVSTARMFLTSTTSLACESSLILALLRCFRLVPHELSTKSFTKRFQGLIFELRLSAHLLFTQKMQDHTSTQSAEGSIAICFRCWAVLRQVEGLGQECPAWRHHQAGTKLVADNGPSERHTKA